MDGSETKTPKNVKMNAGRIIALILAVLVVYCCVYSLVVKAVRNETLPMPLGFGVGVILSGSMEPTYHVNDLIFAVKAKNFKVGDIVVYQTGGTPVVHRVIEADDGSGTVITQGDANNAPDDPVVVSRIKGKVLFAVPFVGAVMRFIKTVPGMIMILIVLFILLLLSIRTREEEKTEESKKTEIEKEIAELREKIGAEASDPRTAMEKEIAELRQKLGETADAEKEQSGR